MPRILYVFIQRPETYLSPKVQKHLKTETPQQCNACVDA